MKKCFRLIAILCFSISFLLKPLPILATEGQKEFIVPDAQLVNSEDKSEIGELTPDIIEYANLFEEENIKASESDIDFSRAYCVYTDVDIFDKLPITREKVEELTTVATKVWAVPVYSNGKTVIVQVSKGMKLDEINQRRLSPNELEDAKTKAGKWRVVASTCYDDIIDFEEEIQEIFKSNNLSEKELEILFFGGVPGIKSVIGVLLDENDAIGVMSLQKDIPGKKIILSKNKIYSLETFAENIKPLQPTDNREKKGTKVGYFIGSGLIVLIVFVLVWKRVRQKEL